MGSRCSKAHVFTLSAPERPTAVRIERIAAHLPIGASRINPSIRGGHCSGFGTRLLPDGLVHARGR